MITKEQHLRELLDTAKKVTASHPDIVICSSLNLYICSSLNLYMRGLITRTPEDIDLKSNKNYYQNGEFYNDYRQSANAGSVEFEAMDKTIRTFSIHFNSNVRADVFHVPNIKTNYDMFEYEGFDFKLEKASDVLDMKRAYLEEFDGELLSKHFRDMVEIFKESPDNLRLLIGILDRKADKALAEKMAGYERQGASEARIREDANAEHSNDNELDDLPF